MPKIYLLLFCFGTLVFACASKKKLAATNQTTKLQHQVEQFIRCHNQRDLACLLKLYHPAYQSLSPIHRPSSLADFIKSTLENLEKNNFEVAIQIKEIESGQDQAFVSMDWQLKTKGAPKDDDPFANVQRVDIWKMDSSNNWCIFRTVIYNDRAF